MATSDHPGEYNSAVASNPKGPETGSKSGAEGGTRTHTGREAQRFLRPSRLPVPPPRRTASIARGPLRLKPRRMPAARHSRVIEVVPASLPRRRAPVRPPSSAPPQFGPHQATIRAWLVADLSAPRKQRHTARRIWQRLVDERGATVAESTVRAYVGRVRRELGSGSTEVTIPQLHPPGEEAEADFGKTRAAANRHTNRTFEVRASHASPRRGARSSGSALATPSGSRWSESTHGARRRAFVPTTAPRAWCLGRPSRSQAPIRALVPPRDSEHHQ